MDRTERFYKIDNLLHVNASVPIERFLGELEVSRATFKRDIEYMRDRLNAPIEWDRSLGGYRYGVARCREMCRSTNSTTLACTGSMSVT